MASSSSSPCSFEPLSSSSVPRHDIFLSHSGAQKPFVTALYQQLRTCYSTFFDITHHSLPLGEDFTYRIFHAARTCRLAVVVLSHEFLQSKWPMLELCTFVEAKPQPKIIPLFFTLSPKDLQQKQNQEVWRRAWAEFAKEDSRIDVSKWDSALKELRKRNGILLNLSDGESACIDKVFSRICENLPPSMRHDFIHYPGIHRMSQDILAEFDKLDINGSKVCVLGMYGVPGSGKSTLCRYLHDHLFQRFAGKVLHLELPTNADDEKLLLKSKILLNRLTNFKNKMDLSTVSHLEQVCRLLRGTDFSNSRVFLVVDNISSEESQNFVITILGLGLAVGSKVLLVSRSRSILHRPFFQKDGPNLSSHYVYDCVSVPSLNKEEALRVLLQSRGGVGLADASALEAALTPRHRQIMEEVVSMSSVGRVKEYLPLVLRIMGEQLRQHEPDLEDWKRMMTSFWTGVGMYKEKALKRLVLQSFKALPQKLQTLFLDAALFIIPLSYLDGESDVVGEAFLHLSLIQGRKSEEIECEMRELQKHGFLTIWDSKYPAPTISVHDFYLEFAASIEEASQYYWSSGLRWSNVQRNQAIKVARNTELGLRTVVLELEEGCEEFEFSPRYSGVKAMVLRNCKSLNILWGFANLTFLASLEIHNCPSLKWVEPPATGCEWPYLRRVRWLNQEEKGCNAERVMQQDRWEAVSMSRKPLWKAFQEFVLRMGMTSRSVVEVAGRLLRMRGLEVLKLEDAGMRQRVDLSGCLPELRVLDLTSDRHMMQFRVCNLPKLEQFVYGGDVESRVPRPNSRCWFCAEPRKGVVIGRDFLAGCPNLQSVYVSCALMEDELQGIRIASSHLKELWVCCLWNLSRLPALAAESESLERLRLWDCPELITNLNFGCAYRNLRELDLGHCPNVTEVTGLDGLPNLRNLCIESCTSLKKVSGLGGLASLETFSLRDCPNLQRCLLPDLESLTEVRHIEYSGPWLMDAAFNVRGLVNLDSLVLAGTITTGTFVGVESLNRVSSLSLRASINSSLPEGFAVRTLTSLKGIGFFHSLRYLALNKFPTLTCLQGIETFHSLRDLMLKKLPTLTCLQGIETCGGLQSLALVQCASIEELPSLSALVNLKKLFCIDCIKLSSVKGLGGLAQLECASFRGCKSLACFPLWDLKDWNTQVLEICGSKFASVEAAMAWAEDEEAPQPLRIASMVALYWELSKESTGNNRESALEMLLDAVLQKMDQSCCNNDGYDGDNYDDEILPTQLSLLAENYHNFGPEEWECCWNSYLERPFWAHGFFKMLYFTRDSESARKYDESRPFPAYRFFEELYFTRESERISERCILLARISESRHRMLEKAKRCFAKLSKQCIVDQCHCNPHVTILVVHLFNCACTSLSFF